MRNNHPPKCPHPSCTGKVFSAQRNLRAHLKLHEQRDREAELSEDEEEELESGSERARKRRRGGEVGRDWICDFEGCDKEFKSVNDSCITLFDFSYRYSPLIEKGIE